VPLVVHPHLHPRRTGVTRHVESVVPALAPHGEARVLESGLYGRALRGELPALGWAEVWRRARAEPAVWHAHRNNELLAGWLLRALGARLRLVYTRHASHRPSWVTRACMRLSDRVVSLTGEIARAVGLPSTVVPHGVDLGRFRPPADRDAAWRGLGRAGRCGLGVVGRIRPAKGQGDFAAAWAQVARRHPDWHGVLVGQALGADVPFAAGLASPRLEWVGEQADVVPWYQGLTVLVQPSHAEGLSLAFLEGLASGCCVVASRVSDFPALVEEGRTGFLFNPGDVQGLAGILEMLCAEPMRARAVGAAAAEEARARFGIDREAAALAAVYRELLGSG
jgi:mannosyltransferase